MVDALNQKVQYEYDANDNLTRVINPKGTSYRYEYDSLDRLVKEINLLEKEKAYSYDPNGNLTGQIDFKGSRISYNYDALNQLIAVLYPDGSKKEYAYDALGNLTAAINGTTIEKFAYNELSLLTHAETVIGEETGSVDFTYNKVGDPLTVTLNGGNNGRRTTSYAYDQLNRLLKVTFPDGAGTEFTYDALDRISERMNSNGTSTVYGYTPRSEVESIINYSDHRHNQVIGSYGYIYNANGQRIYQVEGDGDLTAYEYDPVGQLTKVYYPFQDKKKQADLKERFDLGLLPDTKGQPRFKLNNRFNLRFDDWDSLTQQIDEFNSSLVEPDTESNAGSSNTMRTETELLCDSKRIPPVSSLNPDGNVQSQIRNLYQKIREGAGYLDFSRGFWAEEFTYDATGNVARKENGWGAIDYRYNQANQLVQAGRKQFEYDPNGNLVKETLGKNATDYGYDFDNRLIKVDKSYNLPFFKKAYNREVTFGYDALGRKVKKQTSDYLIQNENEYYIYDGLSTDILAEYQTQKAGLNSPGQKNGLLKNGLGLGNTLKVTEYYYGNGMLLAAGDGNQSNPRTPNPLAGVTFYHQDALDSVVMLTDKNGKVKERYEYDAYGEAYNGKFDDGSFNGIGQQIGNVYGFTGQRYESELGVYSFAFRDYNPRLMRWLEEDPQKDGLNWYVYCGGDPVNNVDLLGLCGEKNIFGDYAKQFATGAADLITFGMHSGQVEELNKYYQQSAKQGTNPTALGMLGASFVGMGKGLVDTFNPIPNLQNALKNNDPLQSAIAGLKTVGLVSIGVRVAEPLINAGKGALENLFNTAVNNPLPMNGRFATVMPQKFAKQLLKGEGYLSGNPEAWITAADDLKKINTINGAAKRLTLVNESGTLRLNSDAVVEFNMENLSESRIASPYNRTNPGFINGGRTGGNAREWVVPSNVNITNVSIRLLK